MHFKGKELISRSTHVAHRSLITVTTVTIISRYFELDLTDITVFGLSLTEGSIAPITFIILILLSINYILNYWGDYVSFKNWNTDDETGKGFDEIAHTKLEATFVNIKTLLDATKEFLDCKKDANFEEAYNILKRTVKNTPYERMEKYLKTLIKGHSQLNFIAIIQLYVWYGLITAGLVIWAICLNFDS